VKVEVRQYTLDDVPAMHQAILESLEHLRPWMPWVALEPLTLDQRVALVENWLEAGTENRVIVVDGKYAGGTGLHDRIGPTGREIGYWVRASLAGQGIATEAARQLTEQAFAIPGVDHVEIHHDKANVASRRVPEKLGYVLVREVEDEVEAPGECGISCEWRRSPLT
jgi:ribosomal-protein-serine acetyltransferase